MAAAPAGAHARLENTSPADGTRLQTAPAAVTLTFGERVLAPKRSIQVLDRRGEHVEVGTSFQPGGRTDQVSVRLPAQLVDNSYTVRFGVISDDGHPVSGTFAFVVGTGPLIGANGIPAGDTGSGDLTELVYGAGRWLGFLGLAGLGGLVFVAVCWPAGAGRRRTHRLLRAGWISAFTGTLLSLFLMGPYAAGQNLLDAFEPDLFAESMRLPAGRVLLLRLAALLALAPLAAWLLRSTAEAFAARETRRSEASDSWARDSWASDSGPNGSGADGPADDRRRQAEAFCMAVTVPLLIGYSGAGHAESGTQPTAVVLSDMLHLGAMAVWLGGVLMLVTAVLPSAPPRELAAALPRFSTIAFASVVVLVATGTVQSWQQVGSWGRFLDTDYGRLLLLKLVVVAGILLVADRSRRVVQRHLVARTPVNAGGYEPEPDDGRPVDPTEVARLRTAVGVELALAVVVLAISAVLVATAPGRLGG